MTTATRILMAAGLVAASVLHAQQAPVRDQARVSLTGTGVVRGLVTATDTARTPLRRALVTLSRTGLEDIRSASTDDEGRFAFVELPAATYTLTATKGGFIGMSAGAVKPGMPGRQIVLREGESAAIAPIALPRGAVIAGRILDSAGRPVWNAQVQASRFVIVDGERQLRSGSATWNATTNSHGDYRIFGLHPGEYLLSAWQNSTMFQSDVTAAELEAAQKPAAARATSQLPPIPTPFTLAPTLYPGTVDESSATPISVTTGEERLGVDVTLQRVPVARVSGTVIGIDGKPARGVNVLRGLRKAPAFTPAVGFGVASAADGSFALAGVAPGDYLLQVRGSSPLQAERAAEMLRLGLANPSENTQGQWANAEVTVNGADVLGITLRMQPGMTVSGTVAAPGSAARPDVTRARVQLSPVASGSVSQFFAAAVDAQNAFRIDGVIPGRYSLSIVPLPAGYSARSAMVGDVDVLDTPFEVPPGAGVSGIVITLTDARTQLGGVLTSASGQPASHLYVLAFSQDRAHWIRNGRRILSAKAGEDGAYALTGLPPGNYFLCALTEIDTTLQYEPTYLEELVPASIKLSLSDGEKKVQHLRAGG